MPGLGWDVRPIGVLVKVLSSCPMPNNSLEPTPEGGAKIGTRLARIGAEGQVSLPARKVYWPQSQALRRTNR